MKHDLFNPTIPEIEQLTSMAYWYPLLVQMGMRTPETIIVHRGSVELMRLLDGEKPEGYEWFKDSLVRAMERIGFPCFLRTGQTSAKHGWGDTCFIKSVEDIDSHIATFLEVSVVANIIGPPLSYDFWVVRKLIETKPVLHYFRNMPIAPEVRFFINDHKVQCFHPYWVPDAFEPEDRGKITPLLIAVMPEDEVYQMAQYVARFFAGYWSVDFLQDAQGEWWCIDMATGDRSYHNPSCQFAEPTP